MQKKEKTMEQIVSTPKQPQTFLIREEEHPLKAGVSIFRVYANNMQPLYIGRETVEEAESRLKQSERVSQISVLYREPGFHANSRIAEQFKHGQGAETQMEMTL